MAAAPFDTDIDHFVERHGPMSGREIDAIRDFEETATLDIVAEVGPLATQQDQGVQHLTGLGDPAARAAIRAAIARIDRHDRDLFDLHVMLFEAPDPHDDGRVAASPAAHAYHSHQVGILNHARGSVMGAAVTYLLGDGPKRDAIIGDFKNHPTWCCPLDRLCSYCHSAGREGRPLDALNAPAGHCIACGDPLELLRCTDTFCPHDTCPDCGRPSQTCDVCPGPAATADTGCWNCHGTGWALQSDCQHDGERRNCGARDSNGRLWLC